MPLVAIEKHRLVVHVEDDFWRLFGGIILPNFEEVGCGFLLDLLPAPKPHVELVLGVRPAGDKKVVVGEEVYGHDEFRVTLPVDLRSFYFHK